MQRLTLAATIGLLPSLAAAAAQAAVPPSRTVIAENGAQRLAWFICDATDGPMVAVVGTRFTPRSVPIRLFLKRGAAAATEVYGIGDGDPGAGQVFFPLTRDGKPAGSLHMVNPGMLNDPLTPTFTSLDLTGKARVTCRWAPGVRFLGFDPRRSVQVRRTPHGLLYESFDFEKPGKPVTTGQVRSSTPSVSVGDGREEATEGGGTRFTFTRAGFTYRIDVPGERPAGPAHLTVLQGARPVQSGAMTAYTFSPPKDLPPEPPAFAPRTDGGPPPDPKPHWTSAIVWKGRGRPDCPGPFNAVSTADCLVAFVRKGGASDMALAFARRMATAGHAGWADGYRQVGSVGVAHVTLPLMANTNEMTMLLPVVGDPVRPDDRDPDATDKNLPAYAAVLRTHPDALPVGASAFERTYVPQPGVQRIVMKRTLATCHACKPLATQHTAFDFEAKSGFMGARVEKVD